MPLNGGVTIEVFPLRGNNFAFQLIRQYDSPPVLGKLQSELYAVFLHQKNLLYRRLHPLDTDIELVIPLLELITPNQRKAIRASNPSTFDDLLT